MVNKFPQDITLSNQNLAGNQALQNSIKCLISLRIKKKFKDILGFEP
jgi:phosphotransferase system HPr-like phosphotransfer protein